MTVDYIENHDPEKEKQHTREGLILLCGEIILMRAGKKKWAAPFLDSRELEEKDFYEAIEELIFEYVDNTDYPQQVLNNKDQYNA